jgi:hypothetical protein
VNGWLVSAGDELGLAEALREVMRTPLPVLTSMGLAGRGVVERQHHPATEGDKLESLFHRYATGK